MSRVLSMEGSMNQISSALREKEEHRTAQRKQDILYLIWHYLGENGYFGCQTMLENEAEINRCVEISDNIDLEIILIDFENYYRMRFNKSPVFHKKIARETTRAAWSKEKHASKKSSKKTSVQPITDVESSNDIHLAMTVTPVLNARNENGSSTELGIDPPRDRRLEISKCIEKLYPPNSELRKIAEDLSMEIVWDKLNVHWEDVIGLEDCKIALKEALVYPLKYPIFFKDKFTPWKGILLEGDPGTGKTMLAKAAATECNCTFFNVTASSLVSKWRGESEKCIRVLFDLAYSQSSAIIFIDEIDWIATGTTGDSLSEPAKRFRSELLVRLDGLVSSERSNVVLLAATNALSSIDGALLRRLEKQINVPRPNKHARLDIFKLYVAPSILDDPEMQNYIEESSQNFTGAHIKSLCKEMWMLQSAPMWKKLERNEFSVKDLKYEISNTEIIYKLLPKQQDYCNSKLSPRYYAKTR